MVIHDAETVGPGRRFAVWVQGCSLGCPGCCNPEMHGEIGPETPVGALEGELRRVAHRVEGVSFLGGEPFEQARPLARLAEAAHALELSVMVFSGYRLDELQVAARAEDGVRSLLERVDVLVDGRFDAGLRTTHRRWIGSSNQRVHFFGDRVREDDPRFTERDTVELRLVGGTLTVSGAPRGARAMHRGRR